MSEKNLTPEVLVPRLGDYLVEKGLISPGDLLKALDRQKQPRPPDSPALLLGNILIEMGVIDRASLDQAITEQIIQLRAALQDANQKLERRVQERTAELREALRKLSELSKLKTNFVANISHELRTPLTHIKGYLELLLSGELGSLEDDQLQSLKVIHHATGRLERLIEDLILFSMSESGDFALNIQPFCLSSVCRAAIDNSQSKADAKSIALILDSLPDLPYVQGDEEKISWVILQLLDNAIKFTPNGGNVSIHLEMEDDNVQLAVTDTGIGIPSDRLDEIFEPFHQLDGSSTRKYGGTGLGLSLASKIMEAHGRKIFVASHPDQGSEFRFSLLTSDTAQ